MKFLILTILLTKITATQNDVMLIIQCAGYTFWQLLMFQYTVLQFTY